MRFIILLFLAIPAGAVSLEEAVQSTLQKNEAVGQSREQLRQSRELVSQAKGSILPTVSLNGTYLIQPKPTDPLVAQFFPEHQKTASVSLTQPLFRGFREFAGLRRQDNYYEAQKQIHIAQMIQLYQDVAQSYMDVLALEQDIRNIEAQQKIYQTRVRDLQGRARRGESSSTEALTAQSTAAALDAEYQIQNSKLIAARENFSLLTGLPLNTALNELTDADKVEALKPLEAYLSRVEERPDVKQQKQQAEAADEDVSIARGAHWPTADVTGNYYFVRPEGLAEDIRWDVQFRVSFPIFEGGVRQSQVRAASSKKGEMNLALNQARRKAQAEIKSLYESIRMRTDQLKFLKLSSELAEKNYQFLLRDSRRGLVRSIDVQLGLTEYRFAKRTYDQARFASRLEKIRLDLAAAYIPTILTKEF